MENREVLKKQKELLEQIDRLADKKSKKCIPANSTSR